MNKRRDKSAAKPLSCGKYFQSNFRKSFAMILSLTLSVFLIYAFKTVVFAVNEASMQGDVVSMQNMTFVLAGSSGAIAPDIVEQIKSNPDVERAFPVVSQHTQYYHFFGMAEILVSFMRGEDIPYAVQRKGLTLASGRMPEPGKNEIVLSRKLADNRGKKIGDYIGKEVDPSDSLQGKLKIVGLLDGDSLLGLSAVDESQASALPNLMVFPRDGKLESFNAWIESISSEKAQYWDKRKAGENYENSSNTLNAIFAILSLAIVIVMAFASANSSYAHYFSRRYEFGMLQSIGYTKAQILSRAAREIGVVNLAGLAGGLALSLVAGCILGKAFFDPHGYIFRLIQPDGLLAELAVPFSTALLGLIPAGWMLSRVGPMTVVEKFE